MGHPGHIQTPTIPLQHVRNRYLHLSTSLQTVSLRLYYGNSILVTRVHCDRSNEFMSSSSHIRRVEISVKPRNFRQNLDVYQL